jgi:hypothetical protein
VVGTAVGVDVGTAVGAAVGVDVGTALGTDVAVGAGEGARLIGLKETVVLEPETIGAEVGDGVA